MHGRTQQALAAEQLEHLADDPVTRRGRIGRPALVAARLEPLKGPDLAIQALAQVDPEIRPHLVVAGFNEGQVPDAVVGDIFLPETLRTQLGLKTKDEIEEMGIEAFNAANESVASYRPNYKRALLINKSNAQAMASADTKTPPTKTTL